MQAARAEFHCSVCARLGVYRFDASPRCCGNRMEFTELLFDEDAHGIHLLERTREGESELLPVALRYPPPPREWPAPPQIEWCVIMIPRGQTRFAGEPVGWIARLATGCAYQMPVGVPMGAGLAPDLEHAVRWVLALIEGGPHNQARTRAEQGAT